ncbi:isopenicillin N synthase family dioxygenase [Undibacterium fentianense]|uniref:2-oxoglutarate-dependent ethylene/succinate-forming enzyme n=1 Tax=Undibacterium fentianense TaxID=2828728 RepID=A0A941IG25_9BURK|nr:isopenicillin N synthase family oxygenase [Undibacterium fentianense]MBR7799590.1 isopenicillin N synthase family oxygenase [Undibacterium fentianense]
MIPIVDLTELRRNPREPKLAELLDTALQNTGFCYLSNHGISLKLIASAQAAALHFFSQSDAFKQKYDIARAIRHSGYVGFSECGMYVDEAMRMYESYDIGLELPAFDIDFLSGNIFYGPNTWPDLLGFKSAVYSYYEAVSDLARMLTHTIEAALGLRFNSLTNMMSKPTAQLRLIHYPENNTVQRNARTHSMMGAHTDYEFFTLLYQTSPGLQTVDVRGNWLDAPPIPNTLVMNVGDMAEVISGGRYRSNPHRVLNTGQERFSMPYFAAFDYQSVIHPMIEAKKNSRQPVIAGEHLLKQVTQDFAYLRMRDGQEKDLYSRLTINSGKLGLVNRNQFLEGKASCLN